MADHSNLFHNALVKIGDIAKNGSRNTQSWWDVLAIVNDALERARKIDCRDQQLKQEG